jgi:hypothetical protein
MNKKKVQTLKIAKLECLFLYFKLLIRNKHMSDKNVW